MFMLHSKPETEGRASAQKPADTQKKILERIKGLAHFTACTAVAFSIAMASQGYAFAADSSWETIFNLMVNVVAAGAALAGIFIIVQGRGRMGGSKVGR